MSFDIVFDPASLDRSSHGSITGRIAVQSGDFAFPESEWSDFPVVIVRWWIDEARALETGSTDAVRRVAKEIVDECRSRQWQSKDVDEIWYAIR